MSFDPFARAPRLRRVLPWVAWAAGVVVVLWRWEVLSPPPSAPAWVKPALVEVRAPVDGIVVDLPHAEGTAVDDEAVLVQLRAPSVEEAETRARLRGAALGVVDDPDVDPGDRPGGDPDLDMDRANQARRLAEERDQAAVQQAKAEASLAEARAERAALTPALERHANLQAQGLATVEAGAELVRQAAVLDERIVALQALVTATTTAAKNTEARWRSLERMPTDAATTATLRLRAEQAEARADTVAAARARASLALRGVDGVVWQLPVPVGGAVQPGDVVAVVARTPAVPEAVAYLSPAMATSVRAGQRVRLVGADGSVCGGTVARLAPIYAPTPTPLLGDPGRPTTTIAATIRLSTIDQTISPTSPTSPTPGMPLRAYFLEE